MRHGDMDMGHGADIRDVVRAWSVTVNDRDRASQIQMLDAFLLIPNSSDTYCGMFAGMLTTSQEEAQVGDSNGRHFRCCDCRERWAYQRESQVCPLQATDFSSTLQLQ
jgi:hypothetical protein